MTDSRDPIDDPLPGDWFVGDEGAVRVDMVKNGEVFYAVFKPHAEMAHQLSRKTLDNWRESCAASRVRWHNGPPEEAGK